MDQRERFRMLAAERGLPYDAVECWLDTIRLYANLSPGLLNPREELPPVSAVPWPGTLAGKLGGLPRLPVGHSWPLGEHDLPLDHAGMVYCAQLPEIDVKLPADGILVFFVMEAWQPDDPPYRVVYIPAGVETVEVPAPPDEDFTVWPERELYASLMYDAPFEGESPVTPLVPDDFNERVPDLGAMQDLSRELWPSDNRDLETGVTMGEHNRSPQHTPEEHIMAAEAQGNPKFDRGHFYDMADELRAKQEWLTLARFQSADAEAFYYRFVTHRDDLAQLDFEKVRTFLEY